MHFSERSTADTSGEILSWRPSAEVRRREIDPTDGITSKQDIVDAMQYLGILDAALRHIEPADKLRIAPGTLGASLEMNAIPNAPDYSPTIESAIRLAYARKPGDFEADVPHSVVIPVHSEMDGFEMSGIGFNDTQALIVRELTHHWIRLEIEEIGGRSQEPTPLV